MAGFAAAFLAIDALFASEWKVAGQPRTAVAYENAPAFEPPADAAWVRIRTQAADAMQASLGPGPLYRWTGVTTVQVFTPPNIGTGMGLMLADAVADLFRARVIPTSDAGIVRFRAPSITVVGVEGAYWQANVVCPFQRDKLA